MILDDFHFLIIGNIGARAGVEDYWLSPGNVNAADGFLQKSSSLRKEFKIKRRP